MGVLLRFASSLSRAAVMALFWTNWGVGELVLVWSGAHKQSLSLSQPTSSAMRCCRVCMLENDTLIPSYFVLHQRWKLHPSVYDAGNFVSVIVGSKQTHCCATWAARNMLEDQVNKDF